MINPILANQQIQQIRAYCSFTKHRFKGCLLLLFFLRRKIMLSSLGYLLFVGITYHHSVLWLNTIFARNREPICIPDNSYPLYPFVLLNFFQNYFSFSCKASHREFCRTNSLNMYVICRKIPNAETTYIGDCSLSYG